MNENDEMFSQTVSPPSPPQTTSSLVHMPCQNKGPFHTQTKKKNEILPSYESHAHYMWIWHLPVCVKMSMCQVL